MKLPGDKEFEPFVTLSLASDQIISVYTSGKHGRFHEMDETNDAYLY